MATQAVYHCKLCGKPLDSSLPICRECFIPFGEENPEHISYAFHSEVFIPDSTEGISVLDLLRTDIENFEVLTPLPKLKLLRLAHCGKLKTVTLHDAPLLQALDLANSRNIASLDLAPSIKLRALDISFCQSLQQISLNWENLEYFMAFHSSLPSLPDAIPNLLFGGFFGCHLDPAQVMKLTNCPKLERLYLPVMSSKIDIADFTFLPQLYFLSAGKITISKFNPQSALQIVDAVVSMPPGFKKLLDENSRKHDLRTHQGQYHNAEHLLYGPYPTPQLDRFPHNLALLGFLRDMKIDLKHENILPDAYDPNLVMMKIAGCLFGTALGDTLGLWAEGKNKQIIQNTLEGGPDITWTHPSLTEHLIKYPRGTFTDDTALSLMFVRSLRHNNGVFSVVEAGKFIKDWINHGIKEHNDPRGFGAGGTTIASTVQHHFDKNPLKASKAVYDKDHRKCGNGGVMKSGVTGCFRFWDEEYVIKTADEFCRITHYSPLCAYSSVVVALAISRELSFACRKEKGQPTEKIPLEQTIEEAFNYIPELKDNEETKELIRHYAYAEKLSDLNFPSHDYRTLQTMSAGLWALRNNLSYSEAIEAILREGGDADTNAACAGACLGARYGFTALPIDVLQDFFFFSCVNKEVKSLCAMMGVNWMLPSYEDFLQQKLT